MVSHATKNEMVEITVAPYLANMFNYAKMKWSRLLTTLILHKDSHGLLTL